MNARQVRDVALCFALICFLAAAAGVVGGLIGYSLAALSDRIGVVPTFGFLTALGIAAPLIIAGVAHLLSRRDER